VMGPVLSFRGLEDASWKISAVVVTDGAAAEVTAGGAPAPGVALWKVKNCTAYRHEFSFPVKAEASTGSYTAAGKPYQIAVPGESDAPRMAYESCNGFSSSKLMKSVDDNNFLWKEMSKRHADAPYHLLLQGGDQVYADAMWETEDVMKDWIALNWEEGNAFKVTPQMTKALNEFYFDLYVTRWSQPEVAAILATVPSIAMWDDHDLIDGWGSYPKDRQTCEVYGAIWKAACKAFAVFQQHLDDTELRPGAISGTRPDATAEFPVTAGAFSYGYEVNGISILAIDMRSQRTADEHVITRQHWDEIFAWIDERADGCHLIVMSSIPVVYPGFDTLETVLGFVPGHQDLEDDMRDHWRSRPHKAERLRMIYRLLKVVADKKIRTTLVSGDVHIAALGIVESTRDPRGGSENIINQLISSGIVHPGPGGAVLFALRYLFDSDDEMDRGIFGRMAQFPGSQTKFIGSRNYLSIEPDDRKKMKPDDRMRLWCNWVIESEVLAAKEENRAPADYTKVIHALPLPPKPPAIRRNTRSRRR